MRRTEKTVEKAGDNRELLGDERVKQAIRDAIDLLDKGKLRTAEPLADGTWQVNEWVKKRSSSTSRSSRSK